MEPARVRFGRCADCGEPLDEVMAEPVRVRMDDSGRAERGVTFLCAKCKAVVSVQFDPYTDKRRQEGAEWFGQRRKEGS